MPWQPEVGFVQGALGLMLSRHVLLTTRKTPALCKLPFYFLFFLLFFLPHHHAVGKDTVYPTRSFLLPQWCR